MCATMSVYAEMLQGGLKIVPRRSQCLYFGKADAYHSKRSQIRHFHTAVGA